MSSCLLTDDPFTAWTLILSAACVLGAAVSALGEAYERGFRAGQEDMRRHVHSVGFAVMREQQDKHAAAVAWRVVRRVFGA